jgi:hypothetical protein
MKTHALYRAYDPLSGEHRPSRFFEAMNDADAQLAELEALRIENASLRAENRSLVTALDAARVQAQGEQQ